MTKNITSTFFPDLSRMTTGFDEMFDRVFTGTSSGFPPYNIEKRNEQEFDIVLAVAGFSKDEIKVTESNGNLRINGKKFDTAKQDEPTYLFRGIANRNFSKEFVLDVNFEVEDVVLENGLLRVKLKKAVPDAEVPREIPIR